MCAKHRSQRRCAGQSVTVTGLSKNACVCVCVCIWDVCFYTVCMSVSIQHVKHLQDIQYPFASCGIYYLLACRTDWMDRDNPTGSGDWETISCLKRRYPKQMCPNPIAIEVATVDGISLADAGNVFYKWVYSSYYVFKNITIIFFVCPTRNGLLNSGFRPWAQNQLLSALYKSIQFS